MGIAQPLEQFSVLVIKKIAYNSYFYMMLDSVINLYTYWAIVLSSIIYFIFWRSTYIGNSYAFFFNDFISLFYSWLVRQLKSLHSRFYSILLLTVFLFILFSNFVGLLPYNFTLTGQFYTTFLLSFFLFIGIIFLICFIYKLNFFKLFIPSGVSNAGLLLFIILIEIISYCIRPFSLSIRLFANMLAGHTLLYILGNFGFTLVLKHIIFIIFISFLIVFFIFFLELAIAFIQAYVFIVLVMIYLNDLYNLSH